MYRTLKFKLITTAAAPPGVATNAEIEPVVISAIVAPGPEYTVSKDSFLYICPCVDNVELLS